MLQAARDGGGWRLNGTKLAVPYGAEADLWLVPASTGAAPVLFLVDPRAPGIEITPQQSTSGQPQAQIRFADCRLADDDMLAASNRAKRSLAGPFNRVRLGSPRFNSGGSRGLAPDDSLYQHTRSVWTSDRIDAGGSATRCRRLYRCRGDALDLFAGGVGPEPGRNRHGGSGNREILGSDRRASCRSRGTASPRWHGGDISYPIHRYFLAATQAGLALEDLSRSSRSSAVKLQQERHRDSHDIRSHG